VAVEHVIGVDLGGTKILAGVIAPDGTVERRYEVPTPLESEMALVEGLDVAVGALMNGSIGAVGFGVPSRIDQRIGRAVSSVNIPLAGLDFRDRMRGRWGVPCGLDNDANAATIAEWRLGAGRGSRDMVMLTLGTGVGGGLILDGRPYRGSDGTAAEIGHMVVVADGPPCQGECTGRGHLEALCSGTAATRRAREAFGPAADAPELLRLADAGDATARGVLEEMGRSLGAAIGSLVNLFVPERIVVGGGFGTAAAQYLFPPALEVARREALEPGRTSIEIVAAELGSEAGLIGAGFVGFEALAA